MQVEYGCWKADPRIIKWMTDNHVASYEQLQGLYEKKIQDIVSGYGRTTSKTIQILTIQSSKYQ